MTLDSPVGSDDHFMPNAAIINDIINNPDQSNIMNLTQHINVSYNRTGSSNPTCAESTYAGGSAAIWAWIINLFSSFLTFIFGFVGGGSGGS